MIVFLEEPNFLAEQLVVVGQATRLEIVLRLLRDGELNASAIGHALPLAQPSISRHLKVLTNSGLLCKRRQGAEALFHIDDARARRLGQLLVELGNTLTAGGDRQENRDDRPLGAAAPGDCP